MTSKTLFRNHLKDVTTADRVIDELFAMRDVGIYVPNGAVRLARTFDYSNYKGARITELADLVVDKYIANPGG